MTNTEDRAIRSQKEAFVDKAWEHFRTPEDIVEKPVFSRLTDAGLDAMFVHFKYCYQEEKKELNR